MAKSLGLLTALGMKSFLTLNAVFHSTDPKRKRRAALLAVAGVVLALTVFAYIALYVFGLCSFGMEALALPWLFLLSSVLVFAVGLFHTGGTLFERHGYDILGSLPLGDAAIVGGRFLCCYLESLLFCLAVLVPGLVTYAVCQHPGAAVVLRFLLCVPFVPLLPLSLTVFFSTLIKLIAGKMRNRSLVEAGLTLLLVVGILGAETLLGEKSEDMTAKELIELTSALEQAIAGVYPLCAWFAAFCSVGTVFELCKPVLLSVGVTAATLLLTVQFFRPISERMASTARRKRANAVSESRGLLRSLWWREWKRYLSSSIYVTNTAMGPLLAVIGSVTLLFLDAKSLIPVEVPVGAMAPFVLCAVLCMMPPASVSISMEGKQHWIAETLPIPASTRLDAKLLMTLSLQLPCVLLSGVLLSFALPMGVTDGIFLFVLPVLFCLFTGELALTADLHLGSTEWEKEVTVVKQSTSALVGGISGMLLGVAGALAAMELPGQFFGVIRVALCVLLSVGAVLLRKHNIEKA